MANWQRLILVAACGASLVGGLFFAVGAAFLWNWHTSVDGPGRNELLEGVAIGALYGVTSLAISAALAVVIRRALPRSAFLALCLPALISGTAIFVWIAVPALP